MGTANRNLVVAQSGGPTPVINSSLQGILESARQTDCIGTVYGARHGIEGVLKEELLDLSAQPREEVSLLRFTPAAGSIGTCRYKLKQGQDEDFQRVLDVFRAHRVGYFLYIGGNDSMDTANKIAALARQRGLDLVAVGVPKTIDNDVGDSEFRLIDHTPGYGSTARYWMHAVQNANEENAGSSPADPVLVMQAMGRKIGFIPAAARLADPDRRDAVADLPRGKALPAGATGRPGERPAASPRPGADRHQRGLRRRRPGRRERLVWAYELRRHADVRRASGGELLEPRRAGRQGRRPGQQRRHRAAAFDRLASPVDLDEAYGVGCKAVELAAAGESGFMATILRNPGSAYSIRYEKVAAGRGRQQRAGISRRLDRPERLRRDRRFPPLRPPAGGQRHDRLADCRRPATAGAIFPRSSPNKKLPTVHSRKRTAMFDLEAKHEWLRRHRLRRLRLRHDGAEAQGVLHPQHDQPLGPARREQIRPRGRRVRQPLLEEPGNQPLSRAGRDAPVAAAAAGSRPPRREDRHPAVAAGLDRRETKLGNPALEKAVADTGDPGLERTLRWSKAINESIAAMVRGVPPFPFVRESLEKLSGRADILVVSATPQAALQREWEEHDLSRFVAAICGQEVGTKKQCMGAAAKYPAGHSLMIGDAPGDHAAAKANHALFFPINPGGEEAELEAVF